MIRFPTSPRNSSGEARRLHNHQCKEHKIQTRKVANGVFWSPEAIRTEERVRRVAVYKGRRVLLVPKSIVRYRIAADHQEYYEDFVLAYLQQENLRAGSSLSRCSRTASGVSRRSR